MIVIRYNVTMTLSKLNLELRTIITQYQQSFSDKSYGEENNEDDLLMNIFNITPELKRENRQYWGRELGMCWQLLVTKLCELTCNNFRPALRIEADEPTDLFIGNGVNSRRLSTISRKRLL